MAGVTNGAQYAIDSLQRNVSSDNFVRNKGDNADMRISGTSLTVNATTTRLSSTLIESQRVAPTGFPASGAATVLDDFALPVVSQWYPVGCRIWLSVIDGLGVNANAYVTIGAGNVPTIVSQSASWSEAGVTAVAIAVAGTTLTLAITGKTVASTGALRLDRVVG